MIWSDRQVSQLHALWLQRDADGKPMFSREQIAEALGVTRDAVIAKLGREYRNGRLERRVNNSNNGGRHRGANQLQRAKAAATQSQAIRQIKPSTPPPLPPLTLPNGRPHDCQWPMWKHGDRAPTPPLFCGAVVLRGHAYCPEHCRLAFHNWHELRRVAALAQHHAPGSV